MWCAAQARIDSAMLEVHIDDCTALSRTIERTLSIMEAEQAEKEQRRGTATSRKTRTTGGEEDEDEVLMRQMGILLTRILEMVRFLEGDRKVLTILPKLTAQQAVNQPRGSIPELLAKLDLMAEPKGRVRYGKMSMRAKAVQAEAMSTKRALQLYSPIAGYRAAQGGGNNEATARVETVEEGEDEAATESEEEDKPGEREVQDGQLSAATEEGADAVRLAESRETAEDSEQVDRFRRQDTASLRLKNAPEPSLEEEEEEEEAAAEGDEEEIRYGVWIEHVNKGESADDGQTRMKMSFMHVAMSSDEVPPLN